MFEHFGGDAGFRYQAHKDALDAGRKLLTTYARDIGERTWFEIDDVPLEYRSELAARLENIRRHVENTIVPAQLGLPEMFRELLEDVTFAQLVTSGQVPPQGRERMRALAFNRIFSDLGEAVDQTAEAASSNRALPGLKRAFDAATEALGWFRTGDAHPELRIFPNDARRLYASGRQLLEERSASTQSKSDAPPPRTTKPARPPAAPPETSTRDLVVNCCGCGTLNRKSRTTCRHCAAALR